MDKITEKWQKKEISNYEYLKYLNEAADRTFSDLTQYNIILLSINLIILLVEGIQYSHGSLSIFKAKN